MQSTQTSGGLKPLVEQGVLSAEPDENWPPVYPAVSRELERALERALKLERALGNAHYLDGGAGKHFVRRVSH